MIGSGVDVAALLVMFVGLAVGLVLVAGVAFALGATLMRGEPLRWRMAVGGVPPLLLLPTAAQYYAVGVAVEWAFGRTEVGRRGFEVVVPDADRRG